VLMLYFLAAGLFESFMHRVNARLIWWMRERKRYSANRFLLRTAAYLLPSSRFYNLFCSCILVSVRVAWIQS
jgi:hypothetical protein